MAILLWAQLEWEMVIGWYHRQSQHLTSHHKGINCLHRKLSPILYCLISSLQHGVLIKIALLKVEVDMPSSRLWKRFSQKLNQLSILVLCTCMQLSQSMQIAVWPYPSICWTSLRQMAILLAVSGVYSLNALGQVHGGCNAVNGCCGDCNDPSTDTASLRTRFKAILVLLILSNSGPSELTAYQMHDPYPQQLLAEDAGTVFAHMTQSVFPKSHPEP